MRVWARLADREKDVVSAETELQRVRAELSASTERVTALEKQAQEQQAAQQQVAQLKQELETITNAKERLDKQYASLKTILDTQIATQVEEGTAANNQTQHLRHHNQTAYEDMPRKEGEDSTFI